MSDIDLTPLIALLAELFPVPECRACGKPEHHAKGLCGRCYDRWLYAGRPDQVPPAVTQAEAMADRIEDYGWLREQGESREMAAIRVGVSLETTYDYDARMRKLEAA